MDGENSERGPPGRTLTEQADEGMLINDRVVRHLRGGIVDGRLPPGSRIR